MSSQYLSVVQDERIEESLKTEAKSSPQGIKKQQKLSFFDYLITHISQALTVILLAYLIYLIANLFVCRAIFLNPNTDSNQPKQKCMNIITSNFFSDQTASSKITPTSQLAAANDEKSQKNSYSPAYLETVITTKKTRTLQGSIRIDDLSPNSKINKRQMQSAIKNSKTTKSKQNQQMENGRSNINKQRETVAQQKNSHKLEAIKQKYQQFAVQLQLNQLVSSAEQQNDNSFRKPTLNFLSSVQRSKIATDYIESSEDPKSLYLQFLGQNQQLSNKIYDSNIKYNSAANENNTFCIIVSTFNNAKSNQIARTMNSIFNQEYTKHHVVVVDQSSTDGTVQLLNDFVRNSPFLLNKTKIIENQGVSQVQAITEGLKYCKNGQIAILINGNSQFLSKKVFTMTNSLYDVEEPKILYSDAFTLDLKNKIIKQTKGRQYNELQKAMNRYRDVGHKYGKYFTFNTNLLQKLKHNYLVDGNGKWLNYSENQALILSLLELSCGKISYLNEPILFNQITSDRNDYERRGLAFQKNIIARKQKLSEC